MQPAMTAWAPCRMKSNGITAPSKASGVTTRLMTGMAKALASGETMETCWNSASSRGVRPSVTTHCACAASRSQFSRATRPLPAYTNKATAPNDSQKPGASTAHGSSTSTASSAQHSTSDIETTRPDHKAAAITASMYSVRCAGTA